LSVHPDSPLVDKTIRDAQLRSRWGAIVIGVKKATGDMIISPTADYLIETGDTLLVVVESTNLRKLEAL
jgi:K+/H+ antiporter YhaU regulatory subunit KhtT